MRKLHLVFHFKEAQQAWWGRDFSESGSFMAQRKARDRTERKNNWESNSKLYCVLLKNIQRENNSRATAGGGGNTNIKMLLPQPVSQSPRYNPKALQIFVLTFITTLSFSQFFHRDLLFSLSSPPSGSGLNWVNTASQALLCVGVTWDLVQQIQAQQMGSSPRIWISNKPLSDADVCHTQGS